MFGEIADSKPGEGKYKLNQKHLVSQKVKRCSENDGDISEGQRHQLRELGYVNLIFTPSHRPCLTLGSLQGGREKAQIGRVSRLGRGEADGLNTVNLLIAERYMGACDSIHGILLGFEESQNEKLGVNNKQPSSKQNLCLITSPFWIFNFPP